MIAFITFAIVALLPATLAGPIKTVIETTTYVKREAATSRSIAPLTTTEFGVTTTISAWDSTGAFKPDHTAIAQAGKARPNADWKHCADYYTVKKGDTCNSVLTNTEYLEVDPEHLLLWNPALGLGCENIKVGMELCVNWIAKDMETEAVATGK